MTKNESLVLLGVGDVGPVHGEMEDYATLAQPALDTGDIRFAQCERLYYASDEASDSDGIRVDLGHRPLQPDQISIFTDSGFDVVSLAGNHTMEWGGEIALATKALFEKKGIQVVGVGRDLAEACEPAIIERNGVRVAFVAYCSVLREKMRKYGVDPDLDEYPHCPHGADSHHSLIAKAVLSQRGLEKASFLPVQIDRQLRPEPLTRDDSRFDEIVSFMDWASAGFDHNFTVENDEVMVTSPR